MVGSFCIGPDFLDRHIFVLDGRFILYWSGLFVSANFCVRRRLFFDWSGLFGSAHFVLDVLGSFFIGSDFFARHILP